MVPVLRRGYQRLALALIALGIPFVTLMSYQFPPARATRSRESVRSVSGETGNHAIETSPALRYAILLYFWLILLEGPLRKWIAPGLANPLILVRDPILVAIYCLVLTSGRVVNTGCISILSALAVSTSLTSLLVGHGNPYVTAYGLDANFLHLPLIFIVGRSLNRDDIVKMGRWLIVLSIPMAVLMSVQFKSDPFSWVNVGPGGLPGTQMATVLGKIRPPGIFNFIVGASQYWSLVTAFFVYGVLVKGVFNRFMIFGCGLALLIAAAVSSSRLMLGGISMVFLMVGVIGLFNRTIVRGLAGFLLPLGFAFLVAQNLDVFHEGRYVFEARLDNTGDTTGFARTASNWSERVFGDFVAVGNAVEKAHLFGFGIGYGTNIGSKLLTGKLAFMADEREWGRVVMEMGPILGLPYLGVRVWIAWLLLSRGLSAARAGNFLPMLLFGACGLNVLSGQFSVASTLAFSVFVAGACLASANVPRQEEQLGIDSMIQAQSLRRGRSRHAAFLHGDQHCES